MPTAHEIARREYLRQEIIRRCLLMGYDDAWFFRQFPHQRIEDTDRLPRWCYLGVSGEPWPTIPTASVDEPLLCMILRSLDCHHPTERHLLFNTHEVFIP